MSTEAQSRGQPIIEPAPSPGPQDVREKIANILRRYGVANSSADHIAAQVLAALAQSDAQPVFAWAYRDPSSKREHLTWQKPTPPYTDIRPLYTTPPALPEGAREWHKEREHLYDLLCVADQLLCELNGGCFPLPGGGERKEYIRDGMLAIREVAGEDYHRRHARANDFMIALRARDARQELAPSADADEVARRVLSNEVEEYELRDPQHTPNDFERMMLEDFGASFLQQLTERGLINTSKPVALPAIPDDDSDFTPDLARKIVAGYQAALRRYAGDAAVQLESRAYDLENLYDKPALADEIGDIAQGLRIRAAARAKPSESAT